MEQTQLVELIKVLKPEEKAQILDFASIPMFNNGRMKANVRPLIEVCLNHPWGMPGQTLEKRYVFERVFPNQPYIEGKLEKLMVEAHKVVRTYLITKRYFREENEFQQGLDFAEEILGRGLTHRYAQMITRLEKILEGTPPGTHYSYRQFLLEYSKYEELTCRNQGKGDLNIPNTLFALEAYYYSNRLLLLNQYLLQQKIAHLTPPERVLNLIEESQIPSVFLENSITINLDFEIFKLLKQASVSADEIQHFFNLLRIHEESIDKKSLSNYYAFLRNLCVLSISADFENLEMAYLLHELYKDNLQRGYLHDNGKLSRSKYMGVTNNALLIGKFEWAYSFIEEYKDELHDENETKDIYRFNLANYLFRVGRFSDCLDNIPDTSPYLLYLLLGKRLELKSLYELQSDLLSYKLDAFKMFLSRTSPKLLSESQRQNHVDFANLLAQLSNSIPGDQKRADKLISRIQEKKQAAEYRWLLEKAHALKGK